MPLHVLVQRTRDSPRNDVNCDDDGWGGGCHEVLLSLTVAALRVKACAACSPTFRNDAVRGEGLGPCHCVIWWNGGQGQMRNEGRRASPLPEELRFDVTSSVRFELTVCLLVSMVDLGKASFSSLLAYVGRKILSPSSIHPLPSHSTSLQSRTTFSMLLSHTI
jgi:hypothetical protein